MENEAIADEIRSALQALLEAAGPEWVMAFLEAGMQEVQGGGEPEPEVMSQGGPKSMASASGLGASGRPMPPMRN